MCKAGNPRPAAAAAAAVPMPVRDSQLVYKLVDQLVYKLKLKC